MFFLKWQLCSFLRKCLPNTQVWIVIVCQFFQVKIMFHQKKADSSPSNSMMAWMLSPETATVLYMPSRYFICTYFPFCCTKWVKDVDSRVSKISIFRASSSTFLGFPGSSDGKESAYSLGEPGSIPRLGRPPGEGNGCPLQYSSLENSSRQRSLAGPSSWGRKEWNTTQRLTH